MRSHFLMSAALLVTASCTESASAPTAMDAVVPRADAAAKNVPVRSELAGGGALPDLSLQSDQGGPYATTRGIQSEIQSIGAWVLDVTARTTRTLRVDLTDSLPGNPGAAPFTTALVKGRFIAKAEDLLPGGFLAMRGVGTTQLSPLSLGNIAYGGATYAIRMNRNNHPATDWALVTCLAVDATNACTQWRITPTGMYDGVSKNVGRLEKVGTTPTFIGFFYFSFDFTVSR